MTTKRKKRKSAERKMSNLFGHPSFFSWHWIIERPGWIVTTVLTVIRK